MALLRANIAFTITPEENEVLALLCRRLSKHTAEIMREAFHEYCDRRQALVKDEVKKQPTHS